MAQSYTQEDWEGAQDAAETAFLVLRKEVERGCIVMTQHAAVACKSAIETCVSVAAHLGIHYDGAADFDALRDLATKAVFQAV